MDITMPMAAPLLESTAVDAEDEKLSRHKGHRHRAKKQVAGPKTQSKVTSKSKIEPDKRAGSSNSLQQTSRSSSDDDEVDCNDDLGSFFGDDDARRRLGPVPAPTMSKKLNGNSRAELHDSIGFNVCENVNSAEDLAGVSSSAEENSCTSIEKDSLDRSTYSESTPRSSHSLIHMETLTPSKPMEYELAHVSSGEASSSTCTSVRKVNRSTQVDNNITYSARPVMCHELNTSARTSGTAELPRRTGNPPIRSAILRFRLDPVTNKFEEVPIVVADTSMYESSSRVLDHAEVPARRSATKSSWELWLLKKSRQDQEKQRLLKNEMLKKEAEETHRNKMKFKKLKQAAFIHEEWVTKKNAEEKLRKKADEEERKLRQEAQHQKRLTIEAKASASFLEWKKRKEEELDKLAVKMKEQAKIKEQEQQATRDRADYAYKVWLRTVGCKKIDRALLYPSSHRNYVFSHTHKNKLRKWHFY